MNQADDPYREIANFIRQAITSVSQLEVLLLVFGARPNGVTVTQISQRLEMNRELAQLHTAQLCKQGLLTAQEQDGVGHFFFADFEVKRTAVIEKLAAMYSTYRIRIIDLIYSPGMDSIREFSEAFRFRKE